jgi:Mrp family chromosome partitioning ATPase
VIIDAPALCAVVDGVVLAHKADGTVMVVSSQRSDARSLQTALDKLRMLGSAHLLGAVLNGVTPDAARGGRLYGRGGVAAWKTLPQAPNAV